MICISRDSLMIDNTTFNDREKMKQKLRPEISPKNN